VYMTHESHDARDSQDSTTLRMVRLVEGTHVGKPGSLGLNSAG